MIFGARGSAARPPSSAEIVTPAEAERRRRVEESLPVGMRIAGAWSWRLLALIAVAAVFIFLIIQLRLIVIPIMVAVLLAALLVPLVQFLQRHRFPKGLAVAVAELGLLAVISGLVVLVVTQIRSDYPDLQTRTVVAYEDFIRYLSGPPFNLSQSELTGYVDQLIGAAQTDGGLVVSGALSVGSTAGHVAAGILLVLFALLFLLIDGGGIWRWVVSLFPRRARAAVDGSGTAGFRAP